MTLSMTVFMGAGRYEWTEEHLILGLTVPANGIPLATQYCVLRTDCLGNFAAVNGCRISTFPAAASYVDLDPSTLGGSPVWPTAPQASDEYSTDRPYSSVLARMSGVTGGRNWYLAGCPDGLIQTPGTAGTGIYYPGAPGWYGKMQNLLGYLTAGTAQANPVWGWRSRTKGGDVVANGFPTAAGGPPNTVGIPMAAPLPGIVVGSEVYASGWRRFSSYEPNINGEHIVVATVPNPIVAGAPVTYYLAGTGNVVPTNFKNVGKLGPITFTAIGYLKGIVRKAVKRSRGGSSGLPRGRSRPSR